MARVREEEEVVDVVVVVVAAVVVAGDDDVVLLLLLLLLDVTAEDMDMKVGDTLASFFLPATEAEEAVGDGILIPGPKSAVGVLCPTRSCPVLRGAAGRTNSPFAPFLPILDARLLSSLKAWISAAFSLSILALTDSLLPLLRWRRCWRARLRDDIWERRQRF